MLAGKLRHRITIQERLNVQDPETGEILPTWTDLHTSIACSVNPLSAREMIAAAAVQSKVVANIKIRHLSNIDSEMRIIWRGKVYDIHGVIPDNESGLEWITLPVSVGVVDKFDEEIVTPPSFVQFVADYPSTVLTDTTIGSLNNGTSPQLNFGFQLNYESASINLVSGGSFTLNSVNEGCFQFLYFHDGSVSESDFFEAAVSRSPLPSMGIGVQLFKQGGNLQVQLIFNDGSTSGADASPSPIISLAGGQLNTGTLSSVLDLSLFPHCKYIVSQNVTTYATGSIPTFTFDNNLVGA